MLLLIIPSFMMKEALQKSVFQCLQVFLLSYVFLKSMNVVGHNDPEWFSLTELSSGNNTRRKISHRKVLTRKNISWLHVFLHFTPFRWPWNSLKCVFMFYCNEWKSSAKLSSHSWAGWYPRLLQTVSETRQCECSEAIMSVVQFVVSTHRIKSWAWPPRLAELFCTYWFHYSTVLYTLWREIFTLTFQNENCISWLQKQKWQIKSNVHSSTWRGSALHQLFSKIEKKKKKTAVGVNVVIYSLLSEKDTTLYERKLSTAIDSRGSIRHGSSVEFGRSVSNTQEQHQEWSFYRRGSGCNKEKYVEKWRKENF